MAEKSNGPRNGDCSSRVIHGPTNPMVSPLLTDLYQFTMAYAYWKAGKHNERAVLVLSSSSLFYIMLLLFLLGMEIHFFFNWGCSISLDFFFVSLLLWLSCLIFKLFATELGTCEIESRGEVITV